MNSVQDDLKVALGKIVLSAPSKEDLTKTVDTWNKSRAVLTPTTTGTSKVEKEAASVKDEVEQKKQAIDEAKNSRMPEGVAAPQQADFLKQRNDDVEAAQRGLERATQRLSHLEEQIPVIKARQSIVISALYKYKPTLDLCLKQNQQ